MCGWAAAIPAPGRSTSAFSTDCGRSSTTPRRKPRTLLLGDFNQTLPRTRAPRAVHEKLMATLGPRLTVATAGPVAGQDHLSIDHLAHGAALRAVGVELIPNRFGADGRISDHAGLVITLAAAEASALPSGL